MCPQQKSPTIICAENIALMQFLHDVPAQPSTRNLHEAAEDDGQLALSLEQERQLTGILAALSSIREDVNLITAVAVREVRTPEERHHTSFEVLVAVNKSKPSDWGDYLGSVSDGFGRIFDTLSRATRAHDSQLEYQVFTDIVSVCRERILSRLRFGKHKRGKTKPPLQKRLRNMCDAIASCRHEDARAFIDGTRRLVAALNHFEKHQTHAELPALVEEADTWTRMGEMSSLFHGVPSSALDGGSCEDYRRIFSKIGQYRTAARRLYRLARKVGALRSVTIKPICLGPDAFIRPDTAGYLPSLTDTLGRVSAKKTQKGLATTLSNFVGKNPLVAEDDFAKDTFRILAESKLHAEVQILIYLKSLPHKEAFSTRVVQSIKKACFLCDEVLALNGLPGIPKSHGRLYSGWMLPSLPGLKQLQLQLNESLQRHANRSIEMVLQKGQKIDLVHPVESTALTVSEVAVTEAGENELVSAPSIGLLSTVATTSEPQALVQEKGCKMLGDHVDDDAEDLSSAISEADTAEMLTMPCAEVMPDGAPQDKKDSSPDKQPLFSLSPGETSSIHTFGSSEMTIQYSTGPDHPKLANALVYRIRQLDEKDVETLKSQNVRFCDVISLDKGSEVTLPGPSPFYVDMGDTVAELIFHE
ncbi:hypothetical protein BN1723_011999 [Verticillium longisporum]|uniref:Uncharacterized protein n=1 Tax=Verticillium longisporum TaxID=100787 RepID=A0A0G4LU18_VERLO|nr:hypothetical protein BN1723_011999 [Verticillium longisporum]CRK25090.1 hypothetical protein BN1708_014135 [Verticillium longisporum]